MQITGFRRAILDEAKAFTRAILDEAIAESNVAFVNPVNCILHDLSFNRCYIFYPANINKIFSTCGFYM